MGLFFDPQKVEMENLKLLQNVYYFYFFHFSTPYTTTKKMKNLFFYSKNLNYEGK